MYQRNAPQGAINPLGTSPTVTGINAFKTEIEIHVSIHREILLVYLTLTLYSKVISVI